VRAQRRFPYHISATGGGAINKLVNPMKIQLRRTDTGNVMICALCTILIISLIGATVLRSSVTHYNVAAKQVKAWKEALYAAEAAGDIGLAEVRKALSSPSTAFSSSSWVTPAVSPAPTPGPGSSCSGQCSWSNKNPLTLGQLDSSGNPTLSAAVTVDKAIDSNTGFTFYRVRAKGTAKLLGLPRVGMDDAVFAGGNHFVANATTRGVGDTLLRKIDFKYDHFKATYGDGDGNSASLQTVSNPQITRRIELVVVPTLLSFTGALKVTGSFFGPGSGGVVDSYDSKNANASYPNGYYPGAYNLTPSNPNYTPFFADSENGDVSVATKNFTEGGPIYGNVTTNGGNVTHSGTQISGTIDNNVPFSIPPLLSPNTSSGYTSQTDSGPTFTYATLPYGSTPATIASNTGTDFANTPNKYVFSSMNQGVTINPVYVKGLDGNSYPQETYVTIVVNGDVGSGTITINKGVNAQIYFTGNVSTKASNIVNNNVANPAPPPPLAGAVPPLTNVSKPGHMQFYGISPPVGTTQAIAIAPPGDLYATFYAPSADMTLTGNPQVYGAIVAHNFSGNGSGGGNTGFHYDKELAGLNSIPIDYHIASYVEDIR